MHDRTGKSSDDREPFRLNDFVEILLVGLSHPGADHPDDLQRELRLMAEQLEQFVTAEKEGPRGRFRRSGGRSRRIVEHRHFTEKVAGPDHCEGTRLVLYSDGGDPDLARFNHIKPVTDIAGRKNYASGGKIALAPFSLEGVKLRAKPSRKTCCSRWRHGRAERKCNYDRVKRRAASVAGNLHSGF